jgi:hypothetical protein
MIGENVVKVLRDQSSVPAKSPPADFNGKIFKNVSWPVDWTFNRSRFALTELQNVLTRGWPSWKE